MPPSQRGTVLLNIWDSPLSWTTLFNAERPCGEVTLGTVRVSWVHHASHPKTAEFHLPIFMVLLYLCIYTL